MCGQKAFAARGELRSARPHCETLRICQIELPPWFSYRKMYAATATWFLVVLVVWVTKLTLFGPEEGQDSRRFYQVAGLVSAAVMGGLGNYLYLLKAHRAVTLARASVRDDRELEAVLRQVGGVTWLGVPVWS